MKIIKNLLLTTTICTSLSATAFASTPFTDLGDWYDPYVETAYNASCVQGKTETTFDPHGKLSLGEFAVMLTKAWYGTELAEQMSKHEEISVWADNYINTLKNQYDETYGTTFSNISGYENMSRYEASYIIGMFLVDKEIADSSADFSGGLENFTDISLETTEETLLSITIANNIMSGRSEDSFDGTGTLTRAEACVIISKLIDLEETGLERDTFDEENVTEKPVEEEPEVEEPSTSTEATITINGVTMTETEYIAYLQGQLTKPGELGSAGISQAAIDQGSLDVKWS